MINEYAAHVIFDLLVDHTSVADYWRNDFIRCQTEGCREWRMPGNLGFGGKFWDYEGRWYVNCYPEDLTSERNEIIVHLNDRLKKLKAALTVE